MTRRETGIIMDILTTAYPQFYAGKDAPDPQKTINLWTEMFAEDDVRLVAAAVKTLIASDEKGFPPHIGAVKSKLRQITERDRMTEIEAWGLVSKALKRGAYNAKQEFEKLPPNLQRLVGTPNQLREWAVMDADTVQSVVASNFQRSFRVRDQADRDYQALPSDVKQLVDGIASGMLLEAGKGELIGGR